MLQTIYRSVISDDTFLKSVLFTHSLLQSSHIMLREAKGRTTGHVLLQEWLWTKYDTALSTVEVKLYILSQLKGHFKGNIVVQNQKGVNNNVIPTMHCYIHNFL